MTDQEEALDRALARGGWEYTATDVRMVLRHLRDEGYVLVAKAELDLCDRRSLLGCYHKWTCGYRVHECYLLRGHHADHAYFHDAVAEAQP